MYNASVKLNCSNFLHYIYFQRIASVKLSCRMFLYSHNICTYVFAKKHFIAGNHFQNELQGFSAKHEDVGRLRQDQNALQVDFRCLSLDLLLCLCDHQACLCLDTANMRKIQ